MDQSSLNENLRFVGLVPGLESTGFASKKVLLLPVITYRLRICLLSAQVPCDGDMEQTSKLSSKLTFSSLVHMDMCYARVAGLYHSWHAPVAGCCLSVFLYSVSSSPHFPFFISLN